MVTIPFVKAHGARNDFLLTWRQDLAREAGDGADVARAICDRNTGVGADGWILLSRSPDSDAAIELWNCDGSRSEMSGNGTRCAAALLIDDRLFDSGGTGGQVAISTGAGIKRLKLLERRGGEFQFEMNMGAARIEELHSAIVPGRNAVIPDAVILNVGNPQCAVFVADFDFDWRTLGAELVQHPHFPNRTNVSFIRVLDRHNLEVRFFERGAGETMSSGTGSTGAAAAAVARNMAESPVRVLTPAGPLDLHWQHDDILLAGPAEIVARGSFLWNQQSGKS